MEETEDVIHSRETINLLNDRLGAEEVRKDGEKKLVIYHGYKYLFYIEDFVLSIEKGWKGGFVDEITKYSRMRKLRMLFLAKKYYKMINIWLERYSDALHYSERVTVFYDVCRELGFISPGMLNFFGAPDEFDNFYGVRYADLFNDLVKRIFDRINTREFKERERTRRNNAKRNEMSVLAMNEEMYKIRSRWVILALTLNYEGRYRQWITLEDVQRHRDRFFAARNFNELMSGIRNYVWTIEQGENTGLHLHVILYYELKYLQDISLAQRIGEYWSDIVTEGKGSYWNSNAWKAAHNQHGHGIGTGQIDRKDEEKREALRKNLLYLTKASQYLMIKNEERIRTFGMGQVPKKMKSGRPRNGKDYGSEIGGIIPEDCNEK